MMKSTVWNKILVLVMSDKDHFQTVLTHKVNNIIIP